MTLTSYPVYSMKWASILQTANHVRDVVSCIIECRQDFSSFSLEIGYTLLFATRYASWPALIWSCGHAFVCLFKNTHGLNVIRVGQSYIMHP